MLQFHYKVTRYLRKIYQSWDWLTKSEDPCHFWKKILYSLFGQCLFLMLSHLLLEVAHVKISILIASHGHAWGSCPFPALKPLVTKYQRPAISSQDTESALYFSFLFSPWPWEILNEAMLLKPCLWYYIQCFEVSRGREIFHLVDIVGIRKPGQHILKYISADCCLPPNILMTLPGS